MDDTENIYVIDDSLTNEEKEHIKKYILEHNELVPNIFK